MSFCFLQSCLTQQKTYSATDTFLSLFRSARPSGLHNTSAITLFISPTVKAMGKYLVGIINTDYQRKIFQSVRFLKFALNIYSLGIATGKLCLGGAMLYSSVRDFVAIFRHLLLAKGVLQRPSCSLIH